MILRPHHLLCTQAYEGKGYNKEFIKNMDKYIKLLREEENFKIKLQIKLDNICKACPSNKGNVCKTESKIIEMDQKVLKHFNLQEGIYEYKALIKIIKDNITKQTFDDICSTCEWYKYDICQKHILK